MTAVFDVQFFEESIFSLILFVAATILQFIEFALCKNWNFSYLIVVCMLLSLIALSLALSVMFVVANP